jgi:hypothetical protein
VGIIVFNGVENGTLDFGHLFHSRWASEELAQQPIQRMVQYVFDELDVDRIATRNAAACPGQVEPLFALGSTKAGEGARPRSGPMGRRSNLWRTRSR